MLQRLREGEHMLLRQTKNSIRAHPELLMISKSSVVPNSLVLVKILFHFSPLLFVM